MPTQLQLFYAASRRAGERDATFLELIAHPTNPLTREDLVANIARRPSLWKRYEGYLDKLPSRTDGRA
jgi:hypothetical protein